MTNEAILELCHLYYDEKTYKHAIRVAEKTKELALLFAISANYTKLLYTLALAHDLYEDTNIKRGVWFESNFELNLSLLTKEKDEDYIEYIKKIKDKATKDPYFFPAYIVKIADIWDHFNEKETLTDKLKNKYCEAITYLL